MIIVKFTVFFRTIIFLMICGFFFCSVCFASEEAEVSVNLPEVLPSEITNDIFNSSFMEFFMSEDTFGAFSFIKLKHIYASRFSYISSSYCSAQFYEQEDESIDNYAVSGVTMQMVPDDPYYTSGYMWGWDRIRMQEALEISTGEDVLVAVLDTGLDYYHSDIFNNVFTNSNEIPDNGIDDDGNGYIDDYLGWDFVGSDSTSPVQDNDVIDVNGHGTHVAGIISATDNTEGIIGVAPGAKILPVKVLDDTGKGTMDAIAYGIKYAVDMGAKVINLSLGGVGIASSFLMDMIDYAIGLGSVIISSAGNESSDVEDIYPANVDEVITVAATDPLDEVASFSNFGQKIDIAAPGVSILSLRAAGTNESFSSSFEPSGDPDAEYIWSQGTSLAAPYVSGVAALIFGEYSTISPWEVEQKLYHSAVDLGDIGHDIYYGYGLLDAYEALLYDPMGPEEYDMLEYFSLNFYDEWTWKDPETGVETGKNLIQGSMTTLHGVDVYKKIDQNTGEEEYLSFDADGVKLHGYKLWSTEHSEYYNLIFDTPLTLFTRYVKEGDIIQESTTFTEHYSGDPGTYTLTTTVNSKLDLDRTDGLLFKDVLTVSHEHFIEIDTGESTTSQSRNAERWYAKNLGAVKELLEDDLGSSETRFLKEGLTYYSSGNIMSELLASADGEGFICYERLDEDYYGSGNGRLNKAIKPDASYVLFVDYWDETDSVKTKELYSVNGVLLEVYNYNEDGSVMDHVEFYDSGRMYRYMRDGDIFVFKDENFYGTSREQGRLERYESSDGSYTEYTYHGQTRKLKEYKIYDSASEQTDTLTFYEEDIFQDPDIYKDPSGNLLKKARIWNGSENGWDDFFIEESVTGEMITVREYSDSYDDEVKCFTRNDSGELIFIRDIEGKLNVRKYDTEGKLLIGSLFDFGVAEGVEWSMNDMVSDSSGDVIATGKYRANNSTDWDLFTLKFQTSNDGSILWSSILDMLGSGFDDSGCQISINEAGNLDVKAFAGTGESQDLNKITYDYSTGNIIDSVWEYSNPPYIFWDQGGPVPVSRTAKKIKGEVETLYSSYYQEKSLINHEVFSSQHSGWAYRYYDDMLIYPYGEFVVFDKNQLVTQGQFDLFLENGHINTKYLKKIEYTYGDTAWFLWGEDRVSVGDVFYDNVVIEKTSTGQWNLYSDFTSVSSGFDDIIDSNNWTSVIQGIYEEDALTLLPEEFTDWRVWCDQNDIEPEFPFLTSESFDNNGDGNIEKQIGLNNYVNTTYEYDAQGRVVKKEITDSSLWGTEEIYGEQVDFISFGPTNGVFVDCGNDSTVNIEDELTLYARARIDRGGGGYLISKIDGDSSQYGMAISPETGGLLFVYGDETSRKQIDLNFSVEDWRDEKWHDFAITVTKAEPANSLWVKGYVDGKAYRSRSTYYGRRRTFFRSNLREDRTVYKKTEVPLLLGARGDGNADVSFCLNGDLVSASLYGRALSNTEIQKMFCGAEISDGIISEWSLGSNERAVWDNAGENAGRIQGLDQGIFKVQTEEYTYYDTPDNTRIESKTLEFPDAEGNVFYHYMNTTDGLMDISKLTEANSNGEIAFEYEYYTGTSTIHYKDSYTDTEMQNLYGTYEYDETGTEINFEPASGPASINLSEQYVDTENNIVSTALSGLFNKIEYLKQTVSSGNVKIALFDSGVNASLFQENIIGEIDLTGQYQTGVNKDTDLYQKTSHGTKTAGIIADTAVDSDIVSFKVINDKERTDSDILSEAINFAVNAGVQIIAMPLTLRGVTDELKKTITQAVEKGVILFAAAGNEGKEIREDELAAQEGIVSVGALDNSGKISSWSSYGKDLDIVLPWDILTKSAGEDEAGTSFSTAYAAAIAALLISEEKDMGLSTEQTIDRLKELTSAVSDKDSTKRIKGDDIKEVTSKYEAIRKNRAQFTGLSPKYDDHSQNIS